MTLSRRLNRRAKGSRTNHGAATCVDACRYLGALIVGALNSESKERLLSPSYCPVPGVWEREPLHNEITAIANGSFKEKCPPDIRGMGFVAHSLEAALWAFWHSENFREGCLKAVNLGDDAYTTGAVYKGLVEEIADRLFALVSGKVSPNEANSGCRRQLNRVNPENASPPGRQDEPNKWNPYLPP